MAFALPAAAQTRYPPGLRVGLTVPAGMTRSARFPGFEDADRKAAITILDLPLAAMEGLERSAHAQTQSEVDNVKREAFPFENGMGVLVSGTKTENGEKVHKWFLIASSATGPVRDLATLISVQVPDKALDVYSDTAVRNALRSVTFRPAPVGSNWRCCRSRSTTLPASASCRCCPAAASSSSTASTTTSPAIPM